MEFWTGTNPVNNKRAKVTGTSETVTDGLGNQAQLTYNADGSVTVEIERPDGTERFQLVREGDRMVKVQGAQREVISVLAL